MTGFTYPRSYAPTKRDDRALQTFIDTYAVTYDEDGQSVTLGSSGGPQIVIYGPNSATTPSDIAVFTANGTEILRWDNSAAMWSIFQEGWTAPSLLNSWVDLGGSFQVAEYRKEASGVVRIRGTVKNGTAGAIIFNLPTGYRPAATNILPTVSNTGFGRLDVKANGDVVHNAAAGTGWYAVDCAFGT